jgi:threonine dehydratase
MLAETDRQLDELVGKPATHTIASVGVGSWAEAVCTHYKSKGLPVVVVAVEPIKQLAFRPASGPKELSLVALGGRL